MACQQFSGIASWQTDNPDSGGGIFPAVPSCPGAIILGGGGPVGRRACSPVIRSPASVQGHVGMLGAVRKCSFKRPSLPGDKLNIRMTCRRMAEKAVLVQSTADVGGTEARGAGVHGGVCPKAASAGTDFPRRAAAPVPCHIQCQRLALVLASSVRGRHF